MNNSSSHLKPILPDHHKSPSFVSTSNSLPEFGDGNVPTNRGLTERIEKINDIYADEHSDPSEHHKRSEYKHRNRCKFYIPIIYPDDRLKIVWDCILLVVLLYSCIEIPITVAFDMPLSLSNPFGIIAFSVDLFLLCDVAINLRTAIFDKYDQLQIISKPSEIVRHYVCGWFIIDFPTSIPLEFILTETGYYIKVFRLVRALRIFKLFRFYRVFRSFNKFMSLLLSRKLVITIKLTKMTVLMLFFANACACIFWAIGKNSIDNGRPSWITSMEIENETKYTQYIYSMYWSVVTLFTTGYGDITPKNTDEQIFAMLTILMGTCLFAYFIGAVGMIISEGDRVKAMRESKYEETEAFCIAHKLSSRLTHAVLSHAKYYYRHNYVFDSMEILNSLPQYIKREVSVSIGERFFRDLKIFEGLNPYINGLLALKLRSLSCNAGYELFKYGQYGKELFIQRTGISVLSDKKQTIKIQRGDVIGEYCFIDPKRKSTLRCVTWCEFWVLDLDDVRNVLQENFPLTWYRYWQLIAKRIRSMKKNNQKLSIPLSDKKEQQLLVLKTKQEKRRRNSSNLATVNISSVHRTPPDGNSFFRELDDSANMLIFRKKKSFVRDKRIKRMYKRLHDKNHLKRQKVRARNKFDKELGLFSKRMGRFIRQNSNGDITEMNDTKLKPGQFTKSTSMYAPEFDSVFSGIQQTINKSHIQLSDISETSIPNIINNNSNHTNNNSIINNDNNNKSSDLIDINHNNNDDIIFNGNNNKCRSSEFIELTNRDIVDEIRNVDDNTVETTDDDDPIHNQKMIAIMQGTDPHLMALGSGLPNTPNRRRTRMRPGQNRRRGFKGGGGKRRMQVQKRPLKKTPTNSIHNAYHRNTMQSMHGIQSINSMRSNHSNHNNYNNHDSTRNHKTKKKRKFVAEIGIPISNSVKSIDFTESQNLINNDNDYNNK